MTATRPQSNGSEPSPLAQQEGDRHLVEALCRGDEAAFITLIDGYHAAMIRVAMIYVHDRATAEDVVQETWVGVLQGIRRFEGRSSLKTWIFHILTNRARTRGRREGRSVPFSSLSKSMVDSGEEAVEPDRFLPATHPRWPHHWASFPSNWDDMADQLLSRETRDYIEQVVATLPPQQREVITLRDVEGWTSDEVCNVLGISETNQRVILHRARSRVRRALEHYLEEE